MPQSRMAFAWLSPPPLVLYPFRFFDPIRKRWVRARYVATLQEIAERQEKWEITGPPEFRSVKIHDGYFTPWKPARPQTDSIANLGPIIEFAGWAAVPHRPIRIVDPSRLR